MKGGQMAIRRGLLVGFVALGAAGCSTIVEGTSQDITLATVPSEAACTVQKNGVIIATVNSTPGRVTVDKSSDDLAVVCNKEGFKETKGMLDSDLAAATFGNVIAGGLVGVVIDSATGASRKYDDSITVTLIADTVVEPETETPVPADAAPAGAAPAAGGMEPVPNPPSS